MRWSGPLALVVGTVVSVAWVPAAAWSDLRAPETRALYAWFLTLVLLALARLHPRGARGEQVLLAVFLAGMPAVYVEAAVRNGTGVAAEVAGGGVYVALALAGLRWPWVLVAGIALHGLTWDVWHPRRGVVADWYAIACAVIDVTLAVYAAGRVSAGSARR